MDSFSLEALAVPSAHKFMVLVSDRQQFPPLLISKSTAYEPNPEICLPRRGVSRYYLQICFLERAPRSAALGAVRTHPRSSRRLPHPFQHAGLGGAPLRARRALAPPLRICSYSKRIEGEAACAPPRRTWAATPPFACAYMSLTRSNPNADTRMLLPCCLLLC